MHKNKQWEAFGLACIMDDDCIPNVRASIFYRFCLGFCFFNYISQVCQYPYNPIFDFFENSVQQLMVEMLRYVF